MRWTSTFSCWASGIATGVGSITWELCCTTSLTRLGQSSMICANYQHPKQLTAEQAADFVPAFDGLNIHQKNTRREEHGRNSALGVHWTMAELERSEHASVLNELVYQYDLSHDGIFPGWGTTEPTIPARPLDLTLLSSLYRKCSILHAISTARWNDVLALHPWTNQA